MNENLDLCKILKDCPKGTKLYSPFFDDCEFVKVCDDYIIVRAASERYSINANGTFPFGTLDSEEIMLFPNREQRSWSKWVCPKPKFDPTTLQAFDRVLASVNETWRCDLFSHHAKGDYKISILIGLGRNDKVIPYNEETKHLVGTSEEVPEFYRYWED